VNKLTQIFYLLTRVLRSIMCFPTLPSHKKTASPYLSSPPLILSLSSPPLILSQFVVSVRRRKLFSQQQTNPITDFLPVR
jgi:hypothetical protein